MPVIPFFVILYKLLVIIEEISLEFMRWNKDTSDSLLFNNILALFGFQQPLSFLVVIFFDLIFGIGVLKNSSGGTLTRLPSKVKVIGDSITLLVCTLKNIDRVVDLEVKEYPKLYASPN